MTETDPLLTDDLGALLALFPQGALRALLDVMRKCRTWSPFPARRAAAAHAAAKDADLRAHAREIARELLWWGSNDVHLDLGATSARAWPTGLPSCARSPATRA